MVKTVVKNNQGWVKKYKDGSTKTFTKSSGKYKQSGGSPKAPKKK